MKLAGMMTVLASVGSSTEKKSDGNPVKRIESLGSHLSKWADVNLCRSEGSATKCLKSQASWKRRIEGLAQRLAERYDQCGSVPDRSGRRKRNTEEDSEDDNEDLMEMDEQLFDLISSDNYNAVGVNGITARYAKNNPAKAVSQLCTAIAKWTKDYLKECQGRRAQNNGYLQTVLRMAKWKIILHNAFLKVQQIEANELDSLTQPRKVPGNGSHQDWRDWFDKKTADNKFRK